MGICGITDAKLQKRGKTRLQLFDFILRKLTVLNGLIQLLACRVAQLLNILLFAPALFFLSQAIEGLSALQAAHQLSAVHIQQFGGFAQDKMSSGSESPRVMRMGRLFMTGFNTVR
ncbi:hypothetical protein D3C86_1752090 [compost metagenome]